MTNVPPLPPPRRLQIATQVQKLELDWPDYIRSFFSAMNILSLSFSALSPRCVVSDWHYLNKIPIMNAVPPVVFAFLVAHQYVLPRIWYVFQYSWHHRRSVVTLMSPKARKNGVKVGGLSPPSLRLRLC